MIPHKPAYCALNVDLYSANDEWLLEDDHRIVVDGTDEARLKGPTPPRSPYNRLSFPGTAIYLTKDPLPDYCIASPKGEEALSSEKGNTAFKHDPEATQHRRLKLSMLAPFSFKQEKAWRNVIILFLIACVLTLAVNTGLLIWSMSKPAGTFDTSRVVFSDDCSRSASIDFWAHMAINVLSTAILAGGNYANQLLLAPTREAIDIAHRKGRSLDIGIQSYTNCMFIGRVKSCLLVIMLLSTIPVHLLYNSIVYSTVSAIDIWSAVVTEDYLQVPQSRSSWESIFDMPLSETNWNLAVSGNLPIIKNMTFAECWDSFTATFIRDYSGYLVIVNDVSLDANRSIIDVVGYNLLVQFNHRLGERPTSLAIPDMTYGISETLNLKPPLQLEPLYCLAVKATPTCTVEIVPALLHVVIICNILKVIVLLLLVLVIKDPLITVGDAIASFMVRHDPATRGLGAVCTDDFRRRTKTQPKKWKMVRERYFKGATGVRWIVTMLFCQVFLLIGVFSLILSNSSVSFTQQWKDGFGSIEDGMRTPLELGLIGDILIINSAQLGLSLVYVFYNTLVTTLILTKEWISYSAGKKGLRVTSPTGEQRSSHFLSLPFKISIPLACITAVLHWMLSQSLFLEQMNSYAASPGQIEVQIKMDSTAGIHGVGYSTLALIILLPAGTLLVGGLFSVGFLRYKAGMPIARTDSRAISAACHVSGDPTKKVQYGMVDGFHVGFANGSVMPLIDGFVTGERSPPEIHSDDDWWSEDGWWPEDSVDGTKRLRTPKVPKLLSKARLQDERHLKNWLK